MLSFLLEDGNRYTQYHIQLLLSFIGVKHSHIQHVIDALTQTIDPNTSITLTNLWKTIRHYLVEQHYSTSLTDLAMAWAMTQRQDCVCILLGGTSGCGKSTLASLLAHRMGITTVLSTDHVRSLLRSFDPNKSQPLLWASSYQAVTNESNGTNNTTIPNTEVEDDEEDEENDTHSQNSSNSHDTLNSINSTTSDKNTTNMDTNDSASSVIQGYETQNQLLVSTLDKMIHGFYQRKENLVIEGVALSIDTMRFLIQKHPHCIPLLIYISNEQKHMERFAIRAKYMTVAPKANKYIHYFDNIRLIQRHLCKAADLWMIPKINNTNVDRSLAIVHTTVINVLSRMKRTGETSLLSTPSSPGILHQEFSKVYDASWSSKQMLRRIREHSSRAIPVQQQQQQQQQQNRMTATNKVMLTPSISEPKQHPTSRTKRHSSRKSHRRSESSSFTYELEHLDDTAWGSLTS
ncbi:uncharacterized protein BX664DRAFT_320570 [Halteromyces radiatus]|uniref:uncharacterized protein n=1 Tax=Halteromyces radiatus TaxID=101107 RepID=UPI00221E9FF6|nr:uncharacterized protein BX664DRAFT_320570 [Halteromyces radiatus]KAI8099173.1 hypothetical protein BX664DRAFT_320570 [Halteromyces radiatus]